MLARRLRALSVLAPRVRHFQSLGVSAALVERLRAAGITSPSAAQRRAIPLILDSHDPRDVVIAAETGGGKTLAYLVPVLERLARHPLPLAEIHRPVALVLTTSQELVGQIASVVSALNSDAARFTTALSSAQQQLPARCALLVATPKALLRATKPRDFAFTQLVVVDEADMLLGGGFERDTKQIIATIRNQPLQRAPLNTREQQERLVDGVRPEDVAGDPRQTVFTYATIPDYGKRSVREYIDYKFPNAAFAVTDDFHRTLPRLEIATHRLEDYQTAEDDDAADPDLPRKKLLLEILARSREDDGHTLVFANSIESADALHAFLTAQPTSSVGDDMLLYHKEVPRDARREILARLNTQPRGLVVVCTDIAARGLDTTTVSHVVQYEFANDVVSYIHRIGRTARAGTSGKVSSIVSEQNALVVDKIEAAGGSSLAGAFSRKRSLRKKVKKLRRDDPRP